jgi:hypothetical protein
LKGTKANICHDFGLHASLGAGKQRKLGNIMAKARATCCTGQCTDNKKDTQQNLSQIIQQPQSSYPAQHIKKQRGAQQNATPLP